MRSPIRALFVLLSSATMVGMGRQGPPIRLTPAEAKAHVGEIATVCGLIDHSSCGTLFFAPPDPEPFTVRLMGPRFERRPDEPFLHRAVCVLGTIERSTSQYSIAVADPSQVSLPEQSEPTPPPFAPDAHSYCERGVVLPKPRMEVKAEYTDEARKKKINGGVLMRGEVTVAGTVGEVQVLRSLDPGLDREAVRAFRQWTFEPGTYMGQPASIIVIVELTFSVR